MEKTLDIGNIKPLISGDLFKVIRKSLTSGISTVYRYVK